MINPKPGRHRQTYKPLYGIVLNSEATGYTQDQVDLLIRSFAQRRVNWHIIDSIKGKESTYQIRKLLSRKPVGIVACGGDSTVNMVGRNLIRRTCALGILPLGKINNIYKSLYGPPNIDKAINIILSGQSRKIDCGLASGKFFLGSIALGLIPNLFEYLNTRRLPKFGISWSRAASRAAADVKPINTTVTVDEFKYEITPITLNVNLLSYSAGLPLMPAAIDDDGRVEITFDTGKGEVIYSSYIRQIFKQKYVYSDEIKMYRGEKIAITEIRGQKMYLDGEITILQNSSLEIETYPAKIRVFRDSN